MVWSDMNRDGQRQPNEPGIPGVTVRLSQVGRLAALSVWETTTDAQGYYRFEGVPVGRYVLSVQAAGVYPTTNVEITVEAGANKVVEVNFGLYELPLHTYVPLLVR